MRKKSFIKKQKTNWQSFKPCQINQTKHKQIPHVIITSLIINRKSCLSKCYFRFYKMYLPEAV